MVVAKNDHAHRALAAQFADHGRSGEPFERGYLAFVWGAPDRPHGVDRPADRPRSEGARSHGGARGRPRGRHPLAGAGTLRRPACRQAARQTLRKAQRPASRWRASSPAGWKPAGPTRSGSIWPRSAIRSWATRSMGPDSAPNRPFCPGRPRPRWRPLADRRSMPIFWRSNTHRAAKFVRFRVGTAARSRPFASMRWPAVGPEPVQSRLATSKGFRRFRAFRQWFG